MMKNKNEIDQGELYLVNPVKYVSLVGGIKSPTATNLLPPISSTALFNWGKF